MYRHVLCALHVRTSGGKPYHEMEKKDRIIHGKNENLIVQPQRERRENEEKRKNKTNQK